MNCAACQCVLVSFGVPICLQCSRDGAARCRGSMEVLPVWRRPGEASLRPGYNSRMGTLASRAFWKHRLPRHRLREYRKAKETPEALLNQSPVTIKLTTSPDPLIANNITANHHAQRLHRSRPTAAAKVPAPSSNNTTPETCPRARNATSAGLLNSQNRSRGGNGLLGH